MFELKFRVMKLVVFIFTILVLVTSSCGSHLKEKWFHYKLEVTYINGDTDTLYHSRYGLSCWLELSSESDDCLRSKADTGAFGHSTKAIACGVRKYKVIKP